MTWRPKTYSGVPHKSQITTSTEIWMIQIFWVRSREANANLNTIKHHTIKIKIIIFIISVRIQPKLSTFFFVFGE